MFPTSSRTFLVGRNARSATARINSSLSSRDLRRRDARLTRRKPTRTRTREDQAGNRHVGRTGVRVARAWYVPPAVSGWRARSSGIVAAVAATVALAACGGGQPPGRKRAQRQLPGRGDDGHVPDLPAPRRAHPPGDRGPQRRQQDDPERRGDDHRPRATGTGGRRRSAHVPERSPDLASHSRPVWIVDRAARARAGTAASRAAPAAPSPRTRTPGRSGR